MIKFQKLFLCTYPSFMGSMEFFKAIVDRFENATKEVSRIRFVFFLPFVFLLYINVFFIELFIY